MFNRYFLGRNYRPAATSTAVILAAPEPTGLSGLAADQAAVTPQTLATLRVAVARRLNDPSMRVWSADELDRYLDQGYAELAQTGRVFWDWTYAENLPNGFSVTSAWEEAAASFRYGIANYTLDDERRLEDEAHRRGSANHTCPDEATLAYLSDCGADVTLAATNDLDATVADVDRALWDETTITALTPRDAVAQDVRYRETQGPVYAYTWRQDGVRAFRKVRVPAAQAATHTISGSFGTVRDHADLSGISTGDTWGVLRRVPGEHPIGPHQWGFPRRPYREGTNVRVEHWRTGRPLDDRDGCELPTPYARYLRDYACAAALSRNGPGHDPKLAAHFTERWSRGLARIERRRRIAVSARVGSFHERTVLGGGRPPRPSLPWNYGQRVRT